jgi:hypothetical protein
MRIVETISSRILLGPPIADGRHGGQRRDSCFSEQRASPRTRRLSGVASRPFCEQFAASARHVVATWACGCVVPGGARVWELTSRWPRQAHPATATRLYRPPGLHSPSAATKASSVMASPATFLAHQGRRRPASPWRARGRRTMTPWPHGAQCPVRSAIDRRSPCDIGQKRNWAGACGLPPGPSMP